mgnify:CR=1 FL=1
MIVDKINRYLSQEELTFNEAIRYQIEKLAGYVFRRQFMENNDTSTEGKLRISSLGRCPRQIAYTYHGFEKKGKQIDSRAKIVFWTGDLTEMTIISLAKLAGVTLTATGLEQIKVELPVSKEVTAEGHPDGLLIHQNKIYLMEIKSMTSYAFERFQWGDIDQSYLVQVNCYMEALGLDACCFVALNKESGVLSERVVTKKPEIIADVRKKVSEIIASTPENLPERPYQPDEKGFYPWQCRYCSYWGHCLPNAKEVLVGNKYKLKEV